MKNLFDFNKNNVTVTLDGNSMAKIQINDKVFSTPYSKELKYIDLSQKLTNLVEKENKKTKNSIQNLFAFGECFKMDVVNVLKGRA